MRSYLDGILALGYSQQSPQKTKNILEVHDLNRHLTNGIPYITQIQLMKFLLPYKINFISYLAKVKIIIICQV